MQRLRTLRLLDVPDIPRTRTNAAPSLKSENRRHPEPVLRKRRRRFRRQPPPKYDFQHNITGDWFGLRNTLSDKGIDITGGYAMEFLGNPVGGRQQGQTYVHNILVQGDADLEKLIGLPNSVFRVRFSQRSGDSLSKQEIGNAFSVQQLYGGGQTYRLVEMQLYHSLFDGPAEPDLWPSFRHRRLPHLAALLPVRQQRLLRSAGVAVLQHAERHHRLSGGDLGRPRPLHFPFEAYWMVGVYDGDPEQDGQNNHGTNFTFGDNGVLVHQRSRLHAAAGPARPARSLQSRRILSFRQLPERRRGHERQQSLCDRPCRPTVLQQQRLLHASRPDVLSGEA